VFQTWIKNLRYHPTKGFIEAHNLNVQGHLLLDSTTPLPVQDQMETLLSALIPQGPFLCFLIIAISRKKMFYPLLQVCAHLVLASPSVLCFQQCASCTRLHVVLENVNALLLCSLSCGCWFVCMSKLVVYLHMLDFSTICHCSLSAFLKGFTESKDSNICYEAYTSYLDFLMFAIKQWEFQQSCHGTLHLTTLLGFLPSIIQQNYKFCFVFDCLLF
jgi:hypothetical protein